AVLYAALLAMSGNAFADPEPETDNQRIVNSIKDKAAFDRVFYSTMQTVISGKATEITEIPTALRATTLTKTLIGMIGYQPQSMYIALVLLKKNYAQEGGSSHIPNR